LKFTAKKEKSRKIFLHTENGVRRSGNTYRGGYTYRAGSTSQPPIITTTQPPIIYCTIIQPPIIYQQPTTYILPQANHK
jgi:hypothetical protein